MPKVTWNMSFDIILCHICIYISSSYDAMASDACNVFGILKGALVDRTLQTCKSGILSHINIIITLQFLLMKLNMVFIDSVSKSCDFQSDKGT